MPNVKTASGTLGHPSVAAIATWSNSGVQERLSWDEWYDFLYAQPERPDPKDPDCKIDPNSSKCSKLPEKGPAVCMSSEDYRKNDTAMADLCLKGKCTYEQNRAATNIRKMEKAAVKGAK